MDDQEAFKHEVWFWFFVAFCVADIALFLVRRLRKMKKYTKHWTVSYIDNDIHAIDIVDEIDADKDNKDDETNDDDNVDDETDDDD